MARNNTQRYEPVVTLNSKAAENALDGLKQKARQVRDALREAGNMGDDRKVRELERELKGIENVQRQIKQQTYDYNTVLRNLNTSSIKDLQKTARSLKNEIKTLTPGTQEFINKSKQLDQVKSRLDQLNGRVRETHSWLSRAGNTFNKYFGMATAAIASLTGISFALRKAGQEAALMDDIYSDVMKTTGMLREEVVWMNEEFKKLSTRTSREELNGLARDAGKLGISGKNDVLEFVRAANQINVALREDLGEGAIRNIGKLSEVFKLTQQMGVEKSFLSIGSAINAIGQASTANEGYLVDFTQRIAGVAYQSGMSIQNVIGFASALDQTGQKVEMSATAFQKFLMKMFSDTAKFAEMANMEVEEFARLLRTDVNQAMITLLTELGNKGGFSQLVPIFQDMGLDGARAVSVLSALATNIDLVTEAQSLANKEFALATSLTQEYNTKNENMQAQLEKARKAFKDQVIELGEKLSPAFLKTTNASTLFLKAIMNINKEFVIAAAVFASTLLVYKSWSVAMALWNTVATAARLVSLSLSAAVALLRGNTIRAAAAWKMFNTAMSASAIGAIITAVTALGIGLYKLITYQSDLTKAVKEYYAETQKAKKEAEDLLNVLENSTAGSEEYKSAMSKLVELYGPYISHLVDEKGYLTDIKKARESINTAIEQTIGLKIKEATINDIVTKSLEKQADHYEDMVKTLVKQAGLSEDVARIYATNYTNAIKSGQKWGYATSELIAKVNRDFSSKAFYGFAEEYTAMLQKMSEAEKKFNFITAGNDEILGPFAETKAQRNARLKKEEAERTAEAEAEKDRLKLAAEERQKLREELFKKELDSISRQEKQRQLSLKKLLHENAITKEQYEALMQDATIQYLMKRNSLYLEYGKDNTDIQSSYYDELIKLADMANKKLDESSKIVEKWIDRLKKQKDEFQDFAGDDDVINYWLDLQKKADEVREKHQQQSGKAFREKELKQLKDMFDAKMISQKEYEDSVKTIKVESALKTAESINTIVQNAADFFASIQEYEYNKLEQEKARELALYGDSADARAEIENKYEKKKMEIQQRYADMDMVVKIAQTLSAGALAGIQAYAQLGPIAGAVAAAFIGLTTSMSVASIVAQRNAIKNNTVAMSSNNSAGMTVNEYYEGGYTPKDSSDRKPVGVVHANEWVAPAAMVRSNPVMFAELERQRISKYSVQSPPKQFASGGFTSQINQGTSSTDMLLMKLIAVMQQQQNTPIPAYVVLDQLNEMQELSQRFKKEGSL